MNLTAAAAHGHGPRIPHTRGDEPVWIVVETLASSVFPTRVGMNRVLSKL